MTKRSLLFASSIVLCSVGAAIGVYFFFTSDHTFSSTTHRIASALLPLSKAANNPQSTPPVPQEFRTVWFTDYSGDLVAAVNRATGQITWEQTFSFPSVPDSGQASNVEFMTVAPNGDLMVTTSNGMLVQEIDRTSHKVVWQYGILNQQYCDKCLHQPKKAFLISNGHEVLVTDANNRRVIIIDKDTNQIVWQYGHTTVMGSQPGYLRGPRFAIPINNETQILLSDTLDKKIMIIDRATKNIVWQFTKSDSTWLQNVYPADDGTFIAEDDLKAEVFEVNKDGKIVWTLHKLADGTALDYVTDTIQLGNGNVLISEGNRRRIIEVNPATGEIVWEFDKAGLITSIAVE